MPGEQQVCVWVYSLLRKGEDKKNIIWLYMRCNNVAHSEVHMYPEKSCKF